ncbi:P-loop containing nucleoside triphosphate hydrolase protein [Mycena olivaceomarginata]|nr:P-loop containing nucleoside triphosphate hydrolase protein [Mycena olivaceomarginata]
MHRRDRNSHTFYNWIYGGQGGSGGEGHDNGTGGGGGAGLGPVVNIQTEHLTVNNFHAGPAVMEASQVANHCPPPSRIFYGRRTILDKMQEYFNRNLDEQHIFLLYGLGGAGKTQIALKFIGLSTQSGKHDNWLLLFDNADDPKINLNSFFPRGNHGNIIITSRNPGLRVYAGCHALVEDMEETDAVKLLLKSAAQDPTTRNEEIAAEIVQELSCLPLAIIQAGAFIAESGALNRYLALFKQNRARLLSRKPAQSHDDYAGTVYTTWQISFDRLTDAARTLLQLCSFLHHQGIFEEIFSLASAYTFQVNGPSEQELQQPMKLLSLFRGLTGGWDSLRFTEVTNELQAYSLINFNIETGLFSIHPLVYSWSRNILTSDEYHYSMVAIVGMAITGISSQAIEPASLWLMPHIDSLLEGEAYATPDFNDQFATIYFYSSRPTEAAKIQNIILQKRRENLGEDHPETLHAMRDMAATYNKLDLPKKAEEILPLLLEKQRKTLGDDHPFTLLIMEDMSRTFSQLGQLHRSEELNTIILEKYRVTLGEDHPDTLRAMGNLAFAYQNLGRITHAAELQTLVLEKRKKIIGADHPATLHTMGGLALCYQALGQLERAVELQTVVLAKRNHVHGEDHPEIPIAMKNLAVTYYQLGRFKKAEELADVILEKQSRTLGADHPETLATTRFLGRIHHQALQELDTTESETVLASEVERSDG